MSESVNGFIHTETATNGWDRMIADARKRIKRLEIAIRTFTQRKAAGAYCPIQDCEDPLSQLEGDAEVGQHGV
jgi:hypothetical protein